MGTERTGLWTVKGDLFKAPEKYLAHGCNTSGIMGAGVAAIVRDRFPLAYRQYQNAEKSLGTIVWSPVPENDKVVLNLITQHLGDPFGDHAVSYDAVDECFKRMRTMFAGEAIAIPQIGAGLGGGDWDVIAKIIDRAATTYAVTCYTL